MWLVYLASATSVCNYHTTNWTSWPPQFLLQQQLLLSVRALWKALSVSGQTLWKDGSIVFLFWMKMLDYYLIIRYVFPFIIFFIHIIHPLYYASPSFSLIFFYDINEWQIFQKFFNNNNIKQLDNAAIIKR